MGPQRGGLLRGSAAHRRDLHGVRQGPAGRRPLLPEDGPGAQALPGQQQRVSAQLTSSNLPPRVKHEYDEAAFKPAISADAATGVMGAYNLVNGRPNTVNPDLNDVVRSWTSKDLYNVSDAWAPHALTDPEHYFDNETEAFAATLKAGIDSFTVDDNKPETMAGLIKDALGRGCSPSRRRPVGAARAVDPVPARPVRPGRRAVREDHQGCDQQRGPSAAQPRDRGQGHGAAEELGAEETACGEGLGEGLGEGSAKAQRRTQRRTR